MNIVLAHGVLGFGKLAGISYFNGVAEHLRKIPGVRVRTSVVPLIGTVAERARTLANEIEQGFHSPDQGQDQLDASKPVNILAHSMGGLDARFMLSHQMLSRAVATLTCIGTPHHGSPVASLLNIFNPFHLQFGPLRGIRFLETLRNQLDAVDDLAEDGARAIDRQCPDQNLKYYEVAGVGRPSDSHTSEFFSVPFALLALRGRSDGIVPYESATRGRKPLRIWDGDHADLVGHDLDKAPLFEAGQFDHLSKYESVVREVAVG